ncbi:MAG: bifunctional oligoribonuclease/PAP phosphatase NrnA [Candidatus Riflebacteria bacterium]|nr:bifunctional oligoribonuclease/PAP phosphatase NrnA [Candidatus Riflebacteria bacterium]
MGAFMFTQLAEALLSRKCVALTTHIVPDGDGLGAAFALKYGLARLGVLSEVVLGSSVARRYDFVAPPAQTRIYPTQVSASWLDRFDAVVVLDCNDWKRIGSLADAFPRDIAKICIDHHVARAGFADVTVLRTDVSAAAEIVYDFICEDRKVPLDAEMALPIYTALYSETGGFSYSNTTTRCHRLAARCLELGVEPAAVHSALHERQSIAALKLLARALDRLRIDRTGKLAWIALELADFSASGASADDTSTLVQYARSIEGVEVAILMFEDEPDSVKVSFRSKGLLDMNELAREFGGGGHPRAAGAKLEMPIHCWPPTPSAGWPRTSRRRPAPPLRPGRPGRLPSPRPGSVRSDRARSIDSSSWWSRA